MYALVHERFCQTREHDATTQCTLEMNLWQRSLTALFGDQPHALHALRMQRAEQANNLIVFHVLVSSDHDRAIFHFLQVEHTRHDGSTRQFFA